MADDLRKLKWHEIAIPAGLVVLMIIAMVIVAIWK